MQRDIEAELKEAIERVLKSPGQKKLVVAGPGTGKTTLFRKLLESSAGDDKSRLVLTFINNLRADLEQSLGGLASVSTLHGYAQLLLHRQRDLRGGLSGDFQCLPGMASLIKKDWTYLREAPEPSFVGRMRGLESGEETDFYIARADYYDGVDFDDSVFRVYEQLKANPDLVKTYDLVLIDEYQDFNRMEAAFIDLLAERSPIVVVGDDDQALYSQLRGASWDFIRELHRAGQYDLFELPFCMRCPEVIVEAVNDVVAVARQLKNLEGRIEKPYRHYAPVKGADSQRYPKIGLVTCSVQRLKANYFGRYIEQAISQIPHEETEEAADNGDPVVLVIGSRQYLRQIDTHLTGCGYLVDTRRDSSGGMDVVDGFRILNEDPESNLGWRVVLEFEKSGLARSVIREADTSSSRLIDVVPSGHEPNHKLPQFE